MSRPLRVVFAGTPAFSLSCLEALLDAPDVEVVGVASQPDRPAGRGLKLTPSPIKQAALAAGIDTITPDKLKGNDEALAWLQSKQPDVLVVVAFGMILPPAWLDAPRVAPVNVHASLLPRWRGAAPIERALLAGDAETGVCLMHMEEGLDTGGVYACRSIPITDMTTGGALWFELSQLGGTLLAEMLPAICSGKLKPTPQPEAGVTYAAKITGADRTVDWNQDADAVDRQVRCFAPKPGARTQLAGRWLKVLAGEAVAASVAKSAGTVLALGGGIDVACAEGVYRITRVQPEGKGAMDVADFLRGAQLKPGDHLG
jgi:methionyl-tRNA formyltransferase